MLLRSSSTPVLGSLVSSVSPIEGVIGGGDGDKVSLPCTQPCMWSMASPSSMSVCEEASSISSWDLDGEPLHNFNLRRAQSETDLHSLGISRSSSSPAQVAAESLLQGTGAHSPYDDFHVSSFQKHKHRSRRLIVQTKLQTIPAYSLYGSGTEDEDEDDENIDKNSTHDNSSVQTSHAFTKGTTLSKENNMIDSFSFQNLTGQQEEENALHFIGNSIISRVNDTAQNDNLKANSEGLFSMGLNPNLYGCEMMQNGITTLDNEYVHPLFLSQGLGLDVVDASLAMGGGGGKSSRKFNTGGDGDNEEVGSNNLEEYYQSMVEVDPENPLLLRNYAQFLFETKHDYPKAEEFYSRAILAQPGDGEVLSQYAKLIWEFHKDEDRASAYFEQAVKASPDDCHVHAAYALFLWDTDKDEEEEHNYNHNFSATGNLYEAVTSAAA